MSTKKQSTTNAVKVARSIAAFTANITRHIEAAKATKSKEEKAIYMSRLTETRKKLAAFKKQHRVQ